MGKQNNLKGLILCAGIGSRMRPLTYSMVKPLIPVANKPVIHYAIEAMKACGIREIGIIVGETGPAVKAALGNGKRWGISLEYIYQEHPGGLAHAALCSEEFMAGSPFMMYLGDNLFEGGITELAKRFTNGNSNATIMLKPVPDPTHFGVALVGKGNKIIKLEEKPKKPKSDLAITGIYCFDSDIFTAAKSIKPSARGELEITDAISWLLNNGRKVDCHIVTGWWHDTGQKKDMLAASRSVLGGIKRKVSGKVADGCEIKGAVIIEKGASVSGSRIEGPVMIGADAVVTDSVIGPYTTIDRGARVTGSEVCDSILLEGCAVVNLPGRLEKALIGPGATISGGESRPRVISAFIGEKCSVEVF